MLERICAFSSCRDFAIKHQACLCQGIDLSILLSTLVTINYHLLDVQQKLSCKIKHVMQYFILSQRIFYTATLQSLQFSMSHCSLHSSIYFCSKRNVLSQYMIYFHSWLHDCYMYYHPINIIKVLNNQTIIINNNNKNKTAKTLLCRVFFLVTYKREI